MIGMQAEATFVIEGWDEEHSEAVDGSTFARVRVTKAFSGAVEGTSTAVLLTATTSAGPAAYTAQEWFSGSVDGRKGTFASQHGAVSDTVEWTIVAGSGTGELEGISGTGGLVIDDDGTHRFTLDYELP
jgi:hypothetical protein